MGYPSFNNPKFPIDYIVGEYYEHDATPVALNPGDYVTFDVSLPAGLSYDSGTNKIKGVATTVADTDITVSHYDSGDVLLNTYPYTIVVLSLNITFSGGSSFATYTTRSDTFSYSVTGSYTSDGVSFDDPSNETVLPDGVTLTLGNTPGLSGYAIEVGDFKFILTTTDVAGHVFRKILPFTVTAGTASGAQIPSINSITTVAAAMNLSGYWDFFHNYKGENGNPNYFWNTYLRTGSAQDALKINARTGDLTSTSEGGSGDPHQVGDFSVVLHDKIVQTDVDPINGETVQLLCPHITGLTSVYIWFTTYDGGTYRLYRRDVVAKTNSASITSSEQMVGLSQNGTNIFVVTAPTVANNWVIHKIDPVALTEGTSTTFAATTGTTVNDLVYTSATTGGNLTVLTNYNGGTGDPPQIYNPTANTVSPYTLTAAKNYTACAYFVDGSSVAYVLFLNATDKSLIRYRLSNNTTSTTSVSGGLFNGTCASDKIYVLNTTTAYVTDSGRDVIYIYTPGSSVTVKKTLDTGAKPVNIIPLENVTVADGVGNARGGIIYPLLAIHQQGLNNILIVEGTNIENTVDTVKFNRLYNDIALPGAPQTNITYTTVGTIKPGTISIIFKTTDLGVLVSTDDGNGVITGVGGAANGTVDYCNGSITVNYPTTTTGTPSLYYENNPTKVIISAETYRSVPISLLGSMFHNLDLCQFDCNKVTIDTSTLRNVKSINRTSTTELTADTVTPLLDDVTITNWPTGHTVTTTTTYGSLPPGLILNWPYGSDTHFSLSGTCTTPGTYVFTVSVVGTEP